MIIQCEGCASKYFLPQGKVPDNPVKVRCPQCQAVFTLVPPPQNVVAGVQESVVSSTAASAAPSAEVPVTPQAAPEPAPLLAAEQAAVDEISAPTVAAPKRKAGKPGRKEARAQRLARVLVSDIVMYNQAKRDKALADGTLMATLGDEIKKSWELYKDKVGEDVAKSTNYFKEALNEILADGQEVF